MRLIFIFGPEKIGQLVTLKKNQISVSTQKDLSKMPKNFGQEYQKL
jgi:hypothetical protein